MKRGEPHGRERGATNPRPPRGGSRRGGERPRGRNAMSVPGSTGPNRAFGLGGVDARQAVRRRGVKWTNPTRGGAQARRDLRISSWSRGAPTGVGALRRGGQGHGGRRDETRLARATDPGSPRGLGPATVQGRGGRAGKATDPLPHPTLGPFQRRACWLAVVPETSKSRPTSRKLPRRLVRREPYLGSRLCRDVPSRLSRCHLSPRALVVRGLLLFRGPDTPRSRGR